MDGIGATQAIRDWERRRVEEGADGAERRLPILALTAHAVKGYEERCLAAGMDGYLIKPVEPAELQAALNRVASESWRAESNPPAPASEEVYFDAATALRRVDGDGQLLREIVDDFTRACEHQLPTFRASLREGDWAAVGRFAHAWKSAAAHFGGSRVTELARSVEDLAGRRDAEAVAVAGAQLGFELEAMCAALPRICRAA
jgi:HPt (histidine-containing phosphotransfer) domain-containing protein